METTRTSQSLNGKRILMGITKSNGGGAQTYVLALAAGAKAQGADVTVMAGAADGTKGAPGVLFDELSKADIPTVFLTNIQRDLGGISERYAFREILQTVRDIRPHVLHINSSKMGLLGALAGRIAGVPTIIFTVHGWPHKEPRSLLWKGAAWIGSWVTIVCSHTVICVSEDDRKHSPTLFFREKLTCIHNGVSIFPLRSREDARDALVAKHRDLPRQTTWLVMNAEVHPNKGIGIAIRAMAELVPHHKNLSLVVCGEGQARAQLETLARTLGVESHVFFLGFVPSARSYLNAADIYLMPSYKEGFPFALLEAGSARLPVIASKVGGIPEIIIDQHTGLFMPRGNTHILAKAIDHLLRDPETAASYGWNLYEEVRTRFSEERMMAETFTLY
jgi:L-malate glycosyltransferase